jgi:WD40 repeat protein
MRRRLQRVVVPGEQEAAERAWTVVQAAFAEYEPRPQPRRRLGLALGIAAAAVSGLVVVAVSPAGPALVRSVRTAVGVNNTETRLAALPSRGRLIVDTGSGPWIVAADGSKRLLGRYTTGSWSPHGLFEVVTRGHELAALDPNGRVRWSIQSDGVIRDARWSRDGYRIAYRSGRFLRVIAGDGTGDRLLASDAAAVPPAWQQAGNHVLAYVTAAGALRVIDADTGTTIALRQITRPPLGLDWSPNGKRLLTRARRSVEVRTASLARVASVAAHAARVVDAAWSPDGSRYAVIQYDPKQDRSSVAIRGRRAQTVFEGTGHIDDLEWSPDGRWLVLGWRTADQWVFARTTGAPRIHAVSQIASQFHSRTFPHPAGWCC